MKRFLLLIIVVLIALLFILNWKQRNQIADCAKAKKEQIECTAKQKYQKSKKWAQDQVKSAL